MAVHGGLPRIAFYSLKTAPRRSDPNCVKPPQELTCPICQADVPLSGDEKPGDEVYCTYCGAPCKMSGDPTNPADWDIEEDF